MKKLFGIGIWTLIACLFITANAMAATEAEKQAAIDAGLVYLATTQLGTIAA